MRVHSCLDEGSSGSLVPIRTLAFLAMADRSKPEPRKPSETQKRQQKRAKEKLALVKEQIADGSLKIRKMTKAERKKFPPQHRNKKRRSG